MDLPEEEKSALENVEHDLYDPKNKMDDVVIHRPRDTRTKDLPTSWGQATPIISAAASSRKLSLGVKLFLGSAILLVAALSFTAWRVLSLRNVVSSANIDMLAEVTPYIEGGEVTPLVVTLRNQNSASLLSATVTLMYKQGTGAQDEQEKIQEKRELGDVAAGEYKRQDFEIVLYGSEAESRDITLKLEYKVAGSNAVFSKVINTTVVLKTPPIAVHIDGPSILSIGQSGAFTITVKNNTSTTSLPSVVQLTLPNTFTIESANPKASSRGTVWAVPPLDPGQARTITLVGNISGTTGETATIKALLGSQGSSVSAIGFVYASQTFDIKLRSSPLVLGVTLDTERGATDSLRYGDKTTLTLTYVNTSDIAIQDVSLKLKLEGTAALYKQVNPTGGYYDSVQQTILWDKGSFPELANVAPHAQGILHVTIPIVAQGINSPQLKLTFTGSGTSATANDVIATLIKSWIVQGSASLSAKTIYKNSSLPNTGPIPPKANTETTYTAMLTVSAQNALTNAKVSFILPVYVSWRNVTTDNAKITYDAKTRTVTWALGTLDAGKSITAGVSLLVRPSQSQVNQIPTITSGIVLDADETISKAHLRMTISALTTQLTGEAWPTNPSQVVE